MLIQGNVGYTLMELLGVVMLFFIITGFAIISFSDYRSIYNKSEAVNQFHQDINLSRLKSVTEGGRGVILVASDQKSYSFGYDYLPYDTSDPVSYDSGAQQFVTNLTNGITISIADPIIFDSRGRVIDKDGILTQHTIDFYSNGTQYSTGTVTPGGSFSD